MFKKLSISFLGFLQATGLVVYVVAISLFFTFITPHLADNVAATKFYAPIVMLLLFVLSAIVSAIILLGRAGVLFWEKNYRDCFRLIFWTVAWGFVYFILFIIYLVLQK